MVYLRAWGMGSALAAKKASQPGRVGHPYLPHRTLAYQARAVRHPTGTSPRSCPRTATRRQPPRSRQSCRDPVESGYAVARLGRACGRRRGGWCLARQRCRRQRRRGCGRVRYAPNHKQALAMLQRRQVTELGPTGEPASPCLQLRIYPVRGSHGRLAAAPQSFPWINAVCATPDSYRPLAGLRAILEIVLLGSRGASHVRPGESHQREHS
jgi:hypothetical protein